MSNKDWRSQALPHILEFMKVTYEFQGDTLREYLGERVGKFPNPKEFGSLFRDMVVYNNLAILVGTTKSTSKAANGSLRGKWRSTLYHDPDALQTIREQVLSIKSLVFTRKLSLEEGLYAAFKAGAQSV